MISFKIGHIAVLLLILIYRIDNFQCYCYLNSPIAQMEASAPPWCFILFYISDCDVQFRYWYHSAHQTATVNSATDAVSLFPPLKAMPLEGCKCARSEAAHQTAMVNSATDAVSYFPQFKVMPPLKRCRWCCLFGWSVGPGICNTCVVSVHHWSDAAVVAKGRSADHTRVVILAK